jgi:hypothetical protein
LQKAQATQLKLALVVLRVLVLQVFLALMVAILFLVPLPELVAVAVQVKQ